MAPLLPTTYSWIALTAITPLVSLILTWAIISVHRKQRHHLKSILLLSILYSQLLLQVFNFCHSTLNLLKLNSFYAYYLNYSFTTLILYKSLSVLSCHFEEFYKYKYPSNYLLNVNSSLLKYHLLVLFLLSLMGSYLFRSLVFVPLIINTNTSAEFASSVFEPVTNSTTAAASTTTSILFMQPGDKLELVIIFLLFHAFVILASLGFILFKYLILSKFCCNSASSSSSCSSLDINIIGTNSTTSSTNLYGGLSAGGAMNSEINSSSHHSTTHLHHQRHYKSNVQSRTTTAVGIVNLIINLALVACTFSNFWLPLLSLPSWPISNMITWSQVIESILTPFVYALIQIQSHHHYASSGGGKGKGGCRSRSNCSSTNSNGSVIYHHNGRRNNSNSASGQHNNMRGENHQLQQQHRNHYQQQPLRHHHHELQYHNHRFPMTNGSLCFNNGEFQYFAGSKNAFASILNNASAYNTFDSSIHPAQSTYSKDSLRCASVTTIANDDFEFLSRRGEQLLHNNNGNNNNVVQGAGAAAAVNINTNSQLNNCAAASNLNRIGGLQLETPQQSTSSSSASSTHTSDSTRTQSTITAASVDGEVDEQSLLKNATRTHTRSGPTTANAATNLLAEYYHISNQNNSRSNHNHNLSNQSFRQRTIVSSAGSDGGMTSITLPSSSLSMNDLDLIAGDEECAEDCVDGDEFSNTHRRLLNGSRSRPSQAAAAAVAAGLLSNMEGILVAKSSNCNSNNVNSKCKYKKNSNYCIKKRFPNSNSSSGGGNNTGANGASNCCTNHAHAHVHTANGKSGLRRVLSLESLHSHNVNESHLAYLDTGERVIVFTTDYI